ncbi:hypothetical protein NL108_017702 [Boleophthalmus pectinirostris]|nr:hypothetical protein NL108_017702 [Boleophthalmus pectinirostris]
MTSEGGTERFLFKRRTRLSFNRATAAAQLVELTFVPSKILNIFPCNVTLLPCDSQHVLPQKKHESEVTFTDIVAFPDVVRKVYLEGFMFEETLISYFQDAIFSFSSLMFFMGETRRIERRHVVVLVQMEEKKQTLL